MSTLYIRLPSKAVADSAQGWHAMACPFALVSHSGVMERKGTAPLPDLSSTIAQTQDVVLILAASDVSLLHVKTPPLSAAKLKSALPNLVEEQLLCNPSDCIIVADNLHNGVRTIAVAQRAWLDQLAKICISFGARHIAALPAQSCLSFTPAQSDQSVMATAAISQQDTGTDLTLLLSQQNSIGISIMPPDNTAEDVVRDESVAREVIQALCAVVPTARIMVYLPQHTIHTYQNLLANMPALQERFSFAADNWKHWINDAHSAKLDLMAGLNANNRPKLDWLPWRWVLILSSVILIINIGALNFEWWHMKSEVKSMRSAMIHIYQSAYPNETVIIDPLAQMRQKISAAERDSGKATATDFSVITASFGEAWANVTATLTSPPAIAALEYHDHGLMIRLKSAPNQFGEHGPSQAGRSVPGPAERIDDEALTQRLKDELIKHDLTLELAPRQSGAQVWTVRSAQ